MGLTRSRTNTYIRAPKESDTGRLTRDRTSDLKNNGNGLAYLGKKVAAGLGSMFEGVTDLVGGVAAEISGDHAYAQYLFEYSDVKDWEEEFTREYNPGGVMSFLGDVASGLGQTAGFVTVGAAGTAVGAPWLGTAGIVASSMGSGVGSAVQKTGKLGFSEYGYGATMGALEGVLEAKLGVGMKTVGNILSGGTAATGAKLFGKTLGRSYGAKLGMHIFSDGIEEAAEELISAVADPLVQRAFGVDPNATFNAKDAWRSAAIGLISGGIFSAVSTATMDGWSVYRGRKARAEGSTGAILEKVGAIRASVRTNNDKKLSDVYAEMLDAKASYDRLTNKESAAADLYLGRMETLRLRYETRLGVDACMKTVQARATPESAARLSALLGRTVTVEDIRENKGDVATVAAWYYMANLYLSDRDTREDTLSNRAVESAYAFAMPTEGQESAFTTETGVSVPVAAVEGGYRVGETVYPTVREARNALISAARTAPVTDVAPEVTAPEAVQKEAEAPTETVDNEAEPSAEQESKSADAEKEQVRSAEEQDRARAAVPGFDTLDVMTKERIYEFIASAGKMETSDVDAVCQMMAVRQGLSVLVSDKVPENGLHYTYPDGRRLILLSSKSPAIARTALHEIAHDLEGSPEYEKLVKRARKNEKALEEAKATVEELEKNYAGSEIEWTDALRESETNAELVSALLTSSSFLTRYAAETKGGLRRVLNTVNRFLHSLPTKKGKIYRAADRLSGLMKKAIEGASVGVRDGVSTIRFSRMNDDSFERNVNRILEMTDAEALKNKEEGNFVSVMKHTPDIILNNVEGAKDHEVIIRFDALYLATRQSGALEGHYHNFQDRIINELPRLISDPDAIVRMKGGRLNLFAEVETEKGKNGILSVELNTVKDINSKYEKYNLVVTFYAANDRHTENRIRNEGIVVEYEKDGLAQVNPQLHKWLAIVNESPSTNSIPDSGEKSNPSEKKSSEKAGNAQFSLAKNEGEKEHPYTKVGARIIRGLAVEKAGITLNRKEAEALDDSIYFAANIAYPGGIEAAADAASEAALAELRKLRAKGAIDGEMGAAFQAAVYEAAKAELPNQTMTRTAPTLVKEKAKAERKAQSLGKKTDAERIGMARNRLIEKIGRLRAYRSNMRKTGNILESENLDELVKRFEHLKHGASLRENEIHDALGALKGFFDSYRGAFDFGSADSKDYLKRPIEGYELSEEIVRWTDDLYNRPKGHAFSVDEYEWLANIVGAVEKMHESFKYIKREGQLVKVEDMAANVAENARLYCDLHKADKRLRGLANKVRDTLYGFVDPVSVVRMLDSYDKNGELTKLFTEIRTAEAEKRAMYADLVRPFEEFLSKNKGYGKRLKDGTVTFRKKKISIDNAIALSLTFKREQALDALLSSTITIRPHGGGASDGIPIAAPGVALDKKSKTYEADRKAALEQLKADITEMEGQFEDVDKDYIKLLTAFYNEKSKDIKSKADDTYMGFSNVVDGFYYPITRGAIEMQLGDARAQVRQLTSIYSLSFNKSTVDSFRQLDILPASETMLSHANGLSSYANLYGVLKNYDRVMNYNVGTKTDIKTPRLLFKDQWEGFDDYMAALLNDVAGVRTQKEMGDKFYDWFSGTFMSTALGLNPKTCASQFGAIFAAGMHPKLHWRSLSMALTVTGTSREEMQAHSMMARERAFEPTAVRAITGTDKIGKIAEFATKGITACDNASIYTIWKACLRQVSDSGLTGEARLEAAGALLDDVIRETQQSADKSGRYALARAKNPLFRAFTIFTSDKNKIFSRMFDGVGQLVTLNAKKEAKLEVSAAAISEARRQLGKTTMGLLLCTFFSAMVVQMFRWLYNDDDNLTKEEGGPVLAEIAEGIADEMVSVIPLADKLYSFFTEGYTISHHFYDQLNDTLSSSKKALELSGALISGEHISSQEITKQLYTMTESTAALFGIPVRNVKNTLVGIARRFMPAVVYEHVDARKRELGTEGNLQRALKSGNERLAEAVIRVRLRDRSAGDKATADRLLELYEAGYTDILPKSIPEKVSTAKEYRAFRRIYEGADKVVLSLLESDLEGEELAAAVKTAYNIYYKRADAEVAGGAMSRTAVLSKLMDVDTLVYHTAKISAIKEKEGADAKAVVLKYLEGTDLTEEEKSIILYGNGYTAKEIREAVKKTARGLTAEESAYLFQETTPAKNKWQ